MFLAIDLLKNPTQKPQSKFCFSHPAHRLHSPPQLQTFSKRELTLFSGLKVDAQSSICNVFW